AARVRLRRRPILGHSPLAGLHLGPSPRAWRHRDLHSEHRLPARLDDRNFCLRPDLPARRGPATARVPGTGADDRYRTNSGSVTFAGWVMLTDRVYNVS